MRKSLWIVLLGVVCSCIVGCSHSSPASDEVLSSAAMEAVLYDYQRLLGLAVQQSMDNPTKEACKQYIFQKHHITQAQFDSSMVWYTRHTIKLSEIYTRLHKRFETEYNNLNQIVGGSNQSAQISPEGDSINLWCFNSYCLISNSPLNTNLSFRLEPDSNYHPNDSFVFSAQFTPLNKVDSFSLVMGLRCEYTRDDNRTQTKLIRQAGTDSLCVHLADAKRLQSLMGFVCLTTPSDSTSSPLILVHQLRLMRYHVALPDSLRAADSITAQPTDSTTETPLAPLPFEMQEITDIESNQPHRITPEELHNRSKKPSQVRPLNQPDNSNLHYSY